MCSFRIPLAHCPIMRTVLLSAAIALAAASRGNADEPDAPAVASAKPPLLGALPASSTNPQANKPAERLREGTRLTDIAGSFVSVGADSVTFSPAGSKDSYRVLENLALQRISQQLDENRGQRQWIVTGLITEFRGANYLLVTKAVVQLQEGDTASTR